MADHLIIKTSSLGDVVHMLPAISDAKRAMPLIKFDWLVEKSFSEIPTWHSSVDKVYPVELRRWRKSLFVFDTWREIREFKRTLQQQAFLKKIDSQGLLKSALLGKASKGLFYGYDKESIREPIASFFYDEKLAVPFHEHAVTRNRLLLSKSLDYSFKNLPLDYGIHDFSGFREAKDKLNSNLKLSDSRYVVALHGTSRIDKEWPIEFWQALLADIESRDEKITFLFPWGNERERQRAELLSKKFSQVIVLPWCSLTELASLIKEADAVIGVDTGLMHVAAAFDQKGVALYPVTKPELTGVRSLSGGIQSLGGEDALNVNDVIMRVREYLNLN